MFTVRKRVLAPTMALAVAASLTACSDDSAGPETGADVEDVAEQPIVEEPVENASFLGQTVTVSAEIEEMVSPQAFWIGGDDQVLVISSGASFEEMGFDISEGLVEDDVVVRVTGTVKEFDLAGLEDEFGVDYDDEVFEPFEGQHVIVADDVSTLVGEQVTVAGEVDDLISTTGFQLDGISWDVVVLDATQASVSEDDFVKVTGTVQQFDIAQIEEDFGVDLDDELYEPFDGEFVLVAESVNPSTATP